MATRKTPAKPRKKEVKLGVMTGTEQWKKPIPRDRTKVAIVGFAPTSMEDVRALFGNPKFEIWGLNQLYIAYPSIVEHCTRWFQIHHRHTYDINVGRDVGHHEWLTQQTKFPIYMQKQEEDVPMSVRFPKENILNTFGTYFTNSISWEIALVCYETMLARELKVPGFDEMHIYGVDMAQNSEYRFERPSVEYFIGIAKGLGIKTVIPDKSDLLKTMWLYPYEDSSPFRTKIYARKQELMVRRNNMAMQEQQVHDQRMQLVGALDNMSYIEQSWEQSAREMAVEKKK